MSSPHFVFGSESTDFLSKSMKRSLQRSGFRAPKSLSSQVESICRLDEFGAGLTLYNSISVCWQSPKLKYDTRYGDWAHDQRIWLGSLLAHEYMHVVQHVLANEAEFGRVDGGGRALLGPEWLVEGSAEYVMVRYFEKNQSIGFDGLQIKDLQATVIASGLSIMDIQKPGAVSTRERFQVSYLAVLLLTARAGEKSIFDYWNALGEGESRDDAFLQAFGVELQSFEADFAILGSDYTAATSFMNSGN